MNTENSQGVAMRGDTVIVLAPKAEMTKEEAIRHACWILVLACHNRSYLTQQMLAIEGT
jgi:hypothetical protein